MTGKVSARKYEREEKGINVEMIQKNIRKLVQYGLNTGLIEPEDQIYTTNRLLELFQLDELEDCNEAVTMAEDELETDRKSVV